MALVVVVLSLSVVRQRGEARREGPEPAPRIPPPADLSLDALRSAGL